MSCVECKKDSPDALKFRILEVQTLHIRDFGGERIIQALGELKDYEVCRACTLEGVRAFVYPAGKIVKASLPFVGLVIAGVVLTLMLRFQENIPALKAIGPLAVVVGVIGTCAKVREIWREHDAVSKMDHDNAVKYCAWKLLVSYAPKKYEDNDITYIPVEDVLTLSPEELAVKYELLPAISRKAYEVIRSNSNE